MTLQISAGHLSVRQYNHGILGARSAISQILAFDLAAFVRRLDGVSSVVNVPCSAVCVDAAYNTTEPAFRLTLNLKWLQLSEGQVRDEELFAVLLTHTLAEMKRLTDGFGLLLGLCLLNDQIIEVVLCNANGHEPVALRTAITA